MKHEEAGKINLRRVDWVEWFQAVHFTGFARNWGLLEATRTVTSVVTPRMPNSCSPTRLACLLPEGGADMDVGSKSTIFRINFSPRDILNKFVPTRTSPSAQWPIWFCKSPLIYAKSYLFSNFYVFLRPKQTFTAPPPCNSIPKSPTPVPSTTESSRVYIKEWTQPSPQ